MLLRPSEWKTLGALSTLGLALVLAIVIGTALGLLVDRWLGTAPVGFLAGFVLGVAAGLFNVYRATRDLTQWW